MKKILVSFILIVGASSLFAQSFEQGNVVISAGYGGCGYGLM